MLNSNFEYAAWAYHYACSTEEICSSNSEVFVSLLLIYNAFNMLKTFDFIHATFSLLIFDIWTQSWDVLLKSQILANDAIMNLCSLIY